MFFHKSSIEEKDRIKEKIPNTNGTAVTLIPSVSIVSLRFLMSFSQFIITKEYRRINVILFVFEKSMV
jgi:hypothetical protein